MSRIGIVLAALAIPAFAQSALWVEVEGGTFRVPGEVLAEVEATLPVEIASARTALGYESRPWANSLIQYRGTIVQGQNSVEIHGSCKQSPPSFDNRKHFYEERVLDGGDCYFVVIYTIEAKRYSKVQFHGVA